VRHLLAVSQELHTNGSAGRTILLRYRREEAWATLVSFLGCLPIQHGQSTSLGSSRERRGSRRLMASDASLF